MRLDSTWQLIDPYKYIDVPKLLGLGDNFNFLPFQIEELLRSIKTPVYIRTGTEERPLTHTDPKKHTELFLERINSKGKLLICIGESFTWSESLYGIASGTSPPKLNPNVQMFYTIQGRIASRFNSDLRTVTYPGNSSSLMLSALERVLEEIVESKKDYKEIIILQQFTDRSRCEFDHPKTPWLAIKQKYFNSYKPKNLQYFIELEQCLEERLDFILKKYNSLNIKCLAWRNFSDWISPTQYDSFHKAPFCINHFKFYLQGDSHPGFPVCNAAGWFHSQYKDCKTEENLRFLEEQAALAEFHYRYNETKYFQNHPNAILCQIFAEYLIEQGARFETI